MGKRYKECTVSELKAKLESGMKKSEIIAELGCPKATFYRILKNIKERDEACIKDEPENLNGNADCSIWIYTS